jgi:hypothetical protein
MVVRHGVPGALPVSGGFVVVVGGGGGGVVVVVVGGGVVVVVGATVVVLVVLVALAEVLAGDAFDARFTPVEHAVASVAAPTASASTILFTRTDYSPAMPGITPTPATTRHCIPGLPRKSVSR